ncbi:murein transglycosylase A [Mergibacter septicus]|uniref:murein transglycosylase A n=1 Tax=Mergibacter septicus TaxID=221402 RepID=UPI001C759229|nr:murein transglycosylase A [Mergibacter septicus]QDJ12936.1 murein transglycosylase A [Mergibacter septicus]
MQKSWRLLLSFLIAIFLLGCHSTTTLENLPSSASKRIAFGAIYQDRQYMSQPIQTVKAINYHTQVKNQADFITQVNYIRQSGVTFLPQFDPTYNKITRWITSGENIEKLTHYGIKLEQLAGVDGYQNVLMTGYYSPVINVSHKKQGKYRYPIYALPKKKYRYSRTKIYAGALRGKKLEIAYSDSLLDNFLLGVQGSGYLNFGKGKLTYIGYAGKNGYPYTSIGRILVEQNKIEADQVSIPTIRQWAAKHPAQLRKLLEHNQSFVFFKPSPNKNVTGAAGVPLVPLAAVASDRQLIPSGSVLLVEVPELTTEGKWSGKHHLHLMIALDIGGAIKGQHLDLYQGKGKQAEHTAGYLRHYGRVWILK